MMGIENPSEYYVSAWYSDGFRFNQNKNNFKYLHLFYMIDTKVKHKGEHTIKVFDLFVSKYPPDNDLWKPTAETLEKFLRVGLFQEAFAKYGSLSENERRLHIISWFEFSGDWMYFVGEVK